MADKKPWKLRLTKLDFLSSCDVPAQGRGGAALLCKRGSDDFSLVAKVASTNDDLGLVFGYAFASSLDGGRSPHIDSQNDVIDSDFLKTVTEFLEAGGRTDVNHDFEGDGKIVYAWPLLPEINRAMGIDSEVVGLAVAVRPSAETYKAFKAGTLTGFSIAGTGIREPLEKTAKGRVVKASLYTNEVDGHQHEISICDGGDMWCSYATSAGAENSHSHSVIFENGIVTILADSGHTHDLAEGQPGVALVPADAIVIVQTSESSSAIMMRGKSAARKSTHSGGVPQVGSMAKEPSMSTDTEKQVTDLTKRAERAERIAKLSGVHKTHFDSLASDDADAFLVKSTADRDVAVIEASKKNDESNKIVYTSKSTGDVYRAKDDSRLVEMAKRMDEQADVIEKSEIRKQALDVLGGMPGDDDTHDFIIAALRKANDPVKAAKAIETLKGMRAETKIGKRAPGIGGDAVPEVFTKQAAYVALEKGLMPFCDEKKIPLAKAWTDGLDAFVMTPAGAALKKAYDELNKPVAATA